MNQEWSARARHDMDVARTGCEQIKRGIEEVGTSEMDGKPQGSGAQRGVARSIKAGKETLLRASRRSPAAAGFGHVAPLPAGSIMVLWR